MTSSPQNVLFLCTGNSCRSVMAEAILARLGEARFRTYSAGSHPAGAVNPYTLDLLASRGHETAHLRSKSWDEFAGPDTPAMNLIVTVCDNAAGEVCPVWPDRPTTAHWPFPDPYAFKGSPPETRAHYNDVYEQIEARLSRFVADPADLA